MSDRKALPHLSIGEAGGIPQACRLVQETLHLRYKSVKTTLVHASANDFYLLSLFENEHGETVTEEAVYFPHHEQVMALLGGRRFVFLNGFMLREQKAGFARENVRIVCLIPLTVGDAARGYIILESERDGVVSVVNDEEFLLHVAGELSGWISKREKDPDPLARLRDVEGLDVDRALATMGGLCDVYLKSLTLFARLTPETAQKTDAFIDADLRAFAIEIHGLKGSLSNIGASHLAFLAAEIENAAKASDLQICRESYPPFRASLLDFHERLSAALPAQNLGERPAGDRQTLLDALQKAKEAADGFDACEAAEIMKRAQEFSYGGDIDALIGEAVSYLESYDCENAAGVLDKIRI